MKQHISILAALICGIAQAAPQVTFAPAPDGSYYCTTCCVGYETNDPADTVDYVNLRFTNTTSQDKTLTISINGKAYSGHGDPTVGITAAAADGTYVIVTANYWTKRKCTVSGRAQHCTTWLFVTGGNFTL